MENKITICQQRVKFIAKFSPTLENPIGFSSQFLFTKLVT